MDKLHRHLGHGLTELRDGWAKSVVIRGWIVARAPRALRRKEFSLFDAKFFLTDMRDHEAGASLISFRTIGA